MEKSPGDEVEANGKSSIFTIKKKSATHFDRVGNLCNLSSEHDKPAYPSAAQAFVNQRRCYTLVYHGDFYNEVRESFVYIVASADAYDAILFLLYFF